MVTGVSRSPVQAITLRRRFAACGRLARFLPACQKIRGKYSDQFRARILNKISFAGLGNRVSDSVLIAFKRRLARAQREIPYSGCCACLVAPWCVAPGRPGFIDNFTIAMLDTELH